MKDNAQRGTRRKIRRCEKQRSKTGERVNVGLYYKIARQRKVSNKSSLSLSQVYFKDVPSLLHRSPVASDAPERSHTLPVGIPSATDRAVSFPLTDDQGPVSRVHAPQAARPVPRCRVQGDRLGAA